MTTIKDKALCTYKYNARKYLFVTDFILLKTRIKNLFKDDHFTIGITPCSGIRMPPNEGSSNYFQLGKTAEHMTLHIAHPAHINNAMIRAC